MVTITYASGAESYIADNTKTFVVWRNGEQLTVQAAQLQVGDYWQPITGQPPVKIDGSVTVA